MVQFCDLIGLIVYYNLTPVRKAVISGPYA